jgi:hypothetical protein
MSPIAESKEDDEADDTSTQEAAENEESADLDSEIASLSSDEWDDSPLPFMGASSLLPVPPRVLETDGAPLVDPRLWLYHPSLGVEQPVLPLPRDDDRQDPLIPEPLPLNTVSESREGTPMFDNVSESILTVLGFGSDRPKFTEEDVQMERAALTDEEKAAALSDTFGKMCTINSHKDKRARRDIDTNTVSFLLGQMRLEIEQIPTHEKQALLDAQSKCKEEFTDARLSAFLRCEGMNAEAS